MLVLYGDRDKAIELFIEHPFDRFCIWSYSLFGQVIRIQ